MQQDAADCPTDVALELSLGDPRSLKVQLIKHRVVGLRHDRGRPHRPARGERHAKPNHAAKAIRAHQSGVPRHWRAPIMAGDNRALLAERVEQADHVANKMKQSVLVDRFGAVGLPIAAHVAGDRVKAGLGERRQLMAPRIPGLGKAMAQQHQRPAALFGDVQVDAVGRDIAVSQFAHVRSRGQAAASATLRPAARPSASSDKGNAARSCRNRDWPCE